MKEPKKYFIKSGVSEIPTSFIEEYCKAGGIDKVYVELDAIPADRAPNGWDVFVKTDSNNCIIIHPVEEKMYSREEVIEIAEYVRVSSQSLPKVRTIDFVKEWIKENL